ncbi:MAG: GrpE protein [Myxococcales bacterium]|nr:GrpE protein [Myxococcales bacterium]
MPDESSQSLDSDDEQPEQHEEPQPESGVEEQQRRDRDSLRRALRDLEAAEARVKRNAERVYDEARSSLVTELFPVLDDLDRSIEAAHASADPALLEAVQMSRRRIDQILARYGAERIDASGGSFDPKLHDAVTTVNVSDPMQNMTVLQQLAPGYRFGDRLLRPAKVVVGRYPS